MILLFIAITLLGNTGHAITSRPDSGSTDTVKQENVRFMLLPIIFSSPDTRLAAGVLPQLVFRTSSSNKPSRIRMDTYYTQNGQYHVLLRPVLWLRKGLLNISGSFSFKEWPTSFYGIGNKTTAKEQEKFTETEYKGSIEGSTHIGSDYYAGVSYSYRHATIDPHDETGMLASGRLPGSDKTVLSSAGLVLKRDSRDNHFYPANGSYHTLALTTSATLLGSDFSFTRLSLDMRKYVHINGPQVLALQGVVSVATGEIPFRMLPGIGSTLRGYSSVRYIDRNMAAIQMEYRVAPLIGRIGFVAFAGTGDVFHLVNDIQLDRLKFSGGIGIRYLFSRSEKINIRLDYGIGKDSSGDYIDLNEAF